MATNKRAGIVVTTVSGKKGTWQVYAAVSSTRKKPITFTDIKGKKHKGLYEFGTRLIVKNGNHIAGNVKQFNTVAGALKNIQAVKNSC